MQAGTDESGNPATGYVDGKSILWEPGCTYQLQTIRISNHGNLKLKYKVAITGITGDTGLNKAIVWTIDNDGTPITAGGNEYKLDAKTNDTVDCDILTISGHMKEDAGNEYQGLHIDGIGITVYATQVEGEYDSNSNDYDKNATYPTEIVSAIENAAMTAVKDQNDEVTEYTYTNTDATVTATVPAAMVVEDQTPTITVKPTTVDETASAAIKADGKDAIAYHISVVPLVASNNEPITVKIYVGKGLNGVQVYHNDKLMTSENNNGTFTYDATTGFVTITTTSFSTFSIAYDAPVALGKDETSYTLAEFNALTAIPEGVKTVYLDIGDVSLADGSVTIGNKSMADVYTSVTGDYSVGQELDDGRVVSSVWNASNSTYLANSNKAGITLYVSGSVNGNPEGGLNQSNSHSIGFVIPDASNIVFTKDFTVNGYFRCYFSWNDSQKLGGGVAAHKVQSVLFDHSTFNGIWIQNGGFNADSLTLDGCIFNAYENKVSANDSNPLWFCNIRTCDVTVKNCTFKASRPIKVVEQTVNGANVTITGNQFDMNLTNSANDASKPKNNAIMFCAITNTSTLGNVVVSGNEVTGGVALLTFYNPTQITMADGATFSVSGNTLGTGVKTSVVWKSNTDFTPDFVK